MKQELINSLEDLIKDLCLIDGKEEIWREFLISLAQYYETDSFDENMKKSIQILIDACSLKKIVKSVDYLKSKIIDFPAESVYKLIILESEKEFEDKNLIIKELKEVLTELATPTIRIWKDIVVTPLIGSLDSERAQSMAEKLLEFISDSRASILIIDVTGINIIDTIVGGFLIEMFNAVKLLGCQVVLTGIKPNIAHTLVKIGIDFDMVTVKRDLESGLKYAIKSIEVKEKGDISYER